jgi:transposase
LKREIKILRNENHYLREQLEFPSKPKGDLQKNNDEKVLKMVKEIQSKGLFLKSYGPCLNKIIIHYYLPLKNIKRLLPYFMDDRSMFFFLNTLASTYRPHRPIQG